MENPFPHPSKKNLQSFLAFKNVFTSLGQWSKMPVIGCVEALLFYQENHCFPNRKDKQTSINLISPKQNMPLPAENFLGVSLQDFLCARVSLTRTNISILLFLWSGRGREGGKVCTLCLFPIPGINRSWEEPGGLCSLSRGCCRQQLWSVLGWCSPTLSLL